MMAYFIYGDTYQIKEDLKSFGCMWDKPNKRWKTPRLSKEDLSYKRLKSIVEAVDGYIVPEHLDDECKKIQGILNER